MKNFELSMALPTPCQQLADENLFGMPVWIKRDDLLHPVVSGNKYRKLKYSLLAIENRSARLVTMGGLWSNHVHATAFAAAELGYRSHALIRGHVGMNSAMLDDCRARGMQIQFVDRISYRLLRTRRDGWQTLVTPDQDWFWIPEGGSAPAALPGVAELIDELPFIPDVMLVACGTAATLAGLLAGLGGRGHVLGIAVIEGADYLHSEVARLLLEAGHPNYQNYQLLTDFHHGGYAKTSLELLQFCADFELRYQIPIEPVYTGKVFYALHKLIRSDLIHRNQTVIALHTGGVQGARGMRDGADRI
ncbi:1-aminocyclopropane-1-carboxylate deaminase [Oxalobacteraceae bacterium GrIS 2.11]